MTYKVIYRYDNGPEEQILMEHMPDSLYEQKLAIQKKRQENIITPYNNIEDWHIKLSQFIDIISIKKREN